LKVIRRIVKMKEKIEREKKGRGDDVFYQNIYSLRKLDCKHE
jgi:hypothetical protein